MKDFNTTDELIAYMAEQEVEERKYMAEGGNRALMDRLPAEESYFVRVARDWGLTIYGHVQLSDYEEDNDGILEARERGYVFGWCYSVACPEGEPGSTHLSNITAVISKAAFEAARAAEWPSLL